GCNGDDRHHEQFRCLSGRASRPEFADKSAFALFRIHASSGVHADLQLHVLNDGGRTDGRRRRSMNPLDKKNPADSQEPEILTNLDQGLDPTVVVTEPDRSVVLREEETLVIERPQKVEIIPGNRPRRVYSGMWGPMELGALGVSLLTFVGLIA